MAGLMRHRRARGLAGSTLVIGFLTGLGYVFRWGKEHLAAIEKSLLPLPDREPETDLQEMLAEAMVRGRPDSDRPTELITGIRKSVSASVVDPRRLCTLSMKAAKMVQLAPEEPMTTIVLRPN
ncbi:hypothetical protein EJ03DRAFT_369597 [Teratosphaeria nubilosa]|uniref:Uncharacterized protein n=1 Tax=Teratosphaeria nubilosa TaxID=161662 RepID=A0A6G1LH55_9PEZI|nr:hypothetical protein EJ03DRAFT_369597 [Teratosphaeria nubilosa]